MRPLSRPFMHLAIDAAPFYKNYAKLYFDPKNLAKGLDRGW